MQETIDNYRVLLARLKENDAIARKFFDIQTIILATHNFEDFFSNLFGGIKEKFGVPHVWLSLVYPGKIPSMINRLAHTEYVKCLFREELNKVFGTTVQPLLINSDLERVHCLLPGNNLFNFRSIAIIPITLDGELIGCFNLADPSSDRFHPDLDPSFLAQLGLVISICLSNVVAHEKLQELVYKDPLTGLLNRRAMEKILKRELARAKRHGVPLSLVFIDLDDFKPINDRFGHDRGDEMLVYVASLFNQLSRETDIIARFAGDEFVLILPDISPPEAGVFMERLKTRLHTCPISIEGTEISINFSYGIAEAAETSDSADFLKIADARLYESKKKKE